MSTPKSAAIPLLVITITTIFSLTPSSASSQYPFHGTKELGFSVNLIHQDSPHSPFYNPTLTKSDRIKAAVQRSRSRRPYLQSLSKRRISPNEPQPQVTSENGGYVMAYSIGTPPVQTYAIADTASELIWLQCLPCRDCYKQKLPIFDPSQSYTYEILGCEDKECSLTEATYCNTTGHTCAYRQLYEDASVSSGDLSLDTLTFSDHGPSGQIRLSHMVIGCGHRNHLTPAEDEPGIIGLNQKTLSFIKQLTISSFSYCLVEKTKTNISSRMHFQSEAKLLGRNTPILENLEGMDAAYFLYLEGISVGFTRLPLPAGIFNMTSSGDGGFMLDSGTTFTELQPEAFNKLVAELIKQMSTRATRTEPWEDLMPCYQTTLNVIKQVAPDLTFHFSGLDLVLNKESTWISDGQGTVCLAIVPATGGNLSVFGNFQQQNVNVGFDLEKKVISFQNMLDCNLTVKGT